MDASLDRTFAIDELKAQRQIDRAYKERNTRKKRHSIRTSARLPSKTLIKNTHNIAGPDGLLSATESGKIDGICNLVCPYSSQNIQAIKAIQLTPEMTKLVMIIALFHLYWLDPASWIAKTANIEAARRRKAPGMSIILDCDLLPWA